MLVFIKCKISNVSLRVSANADLLYFLLQCLVSCPLIKSENKQNYSNRILIPIFIVKIMSRISNIYLHKFPY